MFFYATLNKLFNKQSSVDGMRRQDAHVWSL